VAVDTPIAPVNEAQRRAWDGRDGAMWAAHADLFEASAARYDPALLDAAAIGPADRVLDVGCGTGSVSRAAARRAASVLGVDLSTPMVERARQRAADAGLGNVAFAVADAQVHPFPTAGFEVVLSRTGASFFGDPPAAFANLARATAPGGRLALLTWQALPRNEWIVEVGGLLAGRPLPAPPPNAPGPFGLADPDRTRALLSGAGFTDVRLADVREPIGFGNDPDAAAAVFTELLGWMMEGRDAADRARAQEQLRELLAAHRGPDGITLGSAAWLVTARRP
jgi:SAM-dependent methyltransferase